MDEELVRAIQKYSEIPVVPADTYEMPHTIRNYKERIKANDSISVFDSDFYTLYNRSDARSDDNDHFSNATNGNSDMPFQNEPVIKVSCGRGRGMMSNKFRPGGFSSNDNDIKKDLRRIAPLGYTNEVTELAVNAKKTSRNEQKRTNFSKVDLESSGMSEGKLENALQPPISQLLQNIKKNRDSAYRTFLEQKEQQICNEKLATEKKIKELLEEDRKAKEQIYTHLERGFDNFVASDKRSQTKLNYDFPWGQGCSVNSKLNLKSNTDFPPLSDRKKK